MIPNFRRRQQTEPPVDPKIAKQRAAVTLQTAEVVRDLIAKYPQLTGKKS